MRAGRDSRYKSTIPSPSGLDRAGTIEAAAENFKNRMLSGEAKDGISAFFEKRKPSWVISSGTKS